MKNYIYLDGQKIELSEETAQNLRKKTEKKDPLTVYFDEKTYFVDYGSRIIKLTTSINRKLQNFEARSRETLERAAKWIKLQEYANQVNGEFGYFMHYIGINEDGKFMVFNKSRYRKDMNIPFSSEQLAEDAIKYFGEDFFKDLLI